MLDLSKISLRWNSNNVIYVTISGRITLYLYPSGALLRQLTLYRWAQLSENRVECKLDLDKQIVQE